MQRKRQLRCQWPMDGLRVWWLLLYTTCTALASTGPLAPMSRQSQRPRRLPGCGATALDPSLHPEAGWGGVGVEGREGREGSKVAEVVVVQLLPGLLDRRHPYAPPAGCHGRMRPQAFEQTTGCPPTCARKSVSQLAHAQGGRPRQQAESRRHLACTSMTTDSSISAWWRCSTNMRPMSGILIGPTVSLWTCGDEQIIFCGYVCGV